MFIAHAYQYSKTHSTFLVEVDPQTRRRCGLDTATEDESRAFCEQVFAEDLQGEALLSNPLAMVSATIVSNARWPHGNVVLLGDALRSGHPSVGSGTRLAMQDSIALFEALSVHRDDVPAAFAAFEASRKDASSRFQDAARKSLDWYESVDTRMNLDPVKLSPTTTCDAPGGSVTKTFASAIPRSSSRLKPSPPAKRKPRTSEHHVKETSWTPTNCGVSR